MIRNLKTLGIAMAALLALSATAATAAQAASAHLTAPNSDTPNIWLHATQHPGFEEQIFKTDVGSANCNEFTGTATASKTSTEVTLENISYHSNYFGSAGGPCEFAGQQTAWNFNGCGYRFHLGVWNPTPTDATGTVDIVCPGASEIETVTGLCTLKIPPQTGLGEITYTNNKTTFKELTIHVEVAGIHYTYAGTNCAGRTSGSGTNGTYKGTLTVKAFEDNSGAVGNQTDVEVKEA